MPVFPTIHLNGTSPEDLLFEAMTARDQLVHAVDAMRGAHPNARDYYPQGVDAVAAAIREYDAHYVAVSAAAAFFAAYAEHIADALDQRASRQTVREQPPKPLGNRLDPSELANTSETMQEGR
jgi:hypothetical protein